MNSLPITLSILAITSPNISSTSDLTTPLTRKSSNPTMPQRRRYSLPTLSSSSKTVPTTNSFEEWRLKQQQQPQPQQEQHEQPREEQEQQPTKHARHQQTLEEVAKMVEEHEHNLRRVSFGSAASSPGSRKGSAASSRRSSLVGAPPKPPIPQLSRAQSMNAEDSRFLGRFKEMREKQKETRRQSVGGYAGVGLGVKTAGKDYNPPVTVSKIPGICESREAFGYVRHTDVKVCYRIEVSSPPFRASVVQFVFLKNKKKCSTGAPALQSRQKYVLSKTYVIRAYNIGPIM